MGLLGHPSDRKVHHDPIPLVGGFAVYIAFGLVCLYVMRLYWQHGRFLGRQIREDLK